ncbi:UDP-glucose/GDP-mannose dehydrogenase family protein [Halobacillus sp. GSS1]|uniref:UDP-glucose dehydrogenase family protein n=1 Tax=Halobacillus sp. GSS1 TaxID=2815919 RepID=UPI001A8D1CAB|nr:UDP-glucose/GDP-mannose dehydrogenase family protein [Halobacillus sp. GSS1]MBN9653163.1 UDP-glucose/GDP-mannose dehydrogenase family protein [Halobacillus sp. GSS1]
MRKIAVIGTGYVGLVTGTCLASLGHEVTCVDIDKKRISTLQDGKCPLHEPGLSSLMQSNLNEKRLQFTSDLKKAVQHAEAIFIAVGTPENKDGSADLSYVKTAVKDLSLYINDETVVIIKSTVPPGTNDKVRSWMHLHAGRAFQVVSNPEFLREGSAIHDFFYSDRIVIGSKETEAAQFLEDFYSSMKTPRLHTDPLSAEMIKYASNAFLAAKISFINEISSICEELGADIEQVAQGMGMDRRIGEPFLRAGIGFGGSCFPKDTKALVQVAKETGHSFKLLSTVMDVNERQKNLLIEKALKRYGSLKGKAVAVLGLSFKPNTDDIRESPALSIIQRLQELGAVPIAYDPVVRSIPFCTVVDTIHEVLTGADFAMICTEWPSISDLSLEVYENTMKEAVVFDGRNCYTREDLEGRNIEYHSVGRPSYKGTRSNKPSSRL